MKAIPTIVCSGLAVTFASSLALAQTTPLFPQDHLVGWVKPVAGSGVIHVQEPPAGNCKLVQRCAGVLNKPTYSWAGGTAYDPRFQAAWVSDGDLLSLRMIAPNVCKQLCLSKAFRALSPNQRAVVSGLAVNDRRSELWQLETTAGVYAVTRYSIGKAPNPCVVKIDHCIAKLPVANAFAAGLAFDEPRDLLYIAASFQVATGAYQHVILVNDRKKPCSSICMFRLPQSCLRGMITGLTYDVCKRRLIATDGKFHQEIFVGDPYHCSMKVGSCCTAAGDYGGLGMIPGWKLATVGKPCMPRPCITCPGMGIGLSGGDPSLGNPNFSIDLNNAEGGKLAILALKVGAAGVGFPVSCSRFYAFPWAATFVHVVPGVGCGNTAKQPLPVPTNPALCGFTLTAQWLLICPPFGLGMSDAAQFHFTNS